MNCRWVFWGTADEHFDLCTSFSDCISRYNRVQRISSTFSVWHRNTLRVVSFVNVTWVESRSWFETYFIAYPVLGEKRSNSTTIFSKWVVFKIHLNSTGPNYSMFPVFKIYLHSFTMSHLYNHSLKPWQFFGTILGWLSDLFKGKGTSN